ncbi:MAG: DUF4345 family protein [Pseudomonadota bacterium]
MTFARLFLIAAGLFLVVLGVAYLFWPVQLAALSELALATPAAIIEVQGFYGGQMLGLGAFVLLGAFRERWQAAALLLVALDIGGTAAGRVTGILAGGSAPDVILGLLALETATAVVAVLLLRRHCTDCKA